MGAHCGCCLQRYSGHLIPKFWSKIHCDRELGQKNAWSTKRHFFRWFHRELTHIFFVRLFLYCLVHLILPQYCKNSDSRRFCTLEAVLQYENTQFYLPYYLIMAAKYCLFKFVVLIIQENGINTPHFRKIEGLDYYFDILLHLFQRGNRIH